MSSLYSLVNNYQYLFDKLYDHETGEIDPIVEAQINDLKLSVENKCIAVSSYIQNLDADKKKIEELQKQLDARRANYDKSINKWKAYLQENMEKCEINEIKCPYFTIKLKKNPYGTEILDESLIPEKYMSKKEIVKIEIKPNKALIKEDVLKTGEQIPGVIVAQKNRLEILIDKL